MVKPELFLAAVGARAVRGEQEEMEQAQEVLVLLVPEGAEPMVAVVLGPIRQRSPAGQAALQLLPAIKRGPPVEWAELLVVRQPMGRLVLVAVGPLVR